MNVYLPNGRLPSAYQEVEYIGSDRSVGQYIHTNIIPVSNTGLYLKASSQNITNDCVYVGAATNSSDTGNKYGLGGNQSAIYYGYNDWLKHIYRPSATLDTVFELELNYKNSGVFKKDGITYTGDSATTIGTLNTIGYPLNIFGHNGAGTAQYFSSIKLYNLKVSSGSNIIADFVPCYRKSDSVIGLYDLVNNQFYTNSGSGTFSKGNDVTMAVLKNAYIGEVWTPGSNTIAYFPLETDQADHKGSLTLPVTGTKQTIGYLFNTNQSWVQVHSSATKFINFWINVQSINATKCLCGNLLSGYVFFYRNNNNSSVVNRFGIFTGSGGSGAVTSNQISMTTSAWHHICLGYNSNGAVGYLDGVNVFTTSSTPYAGGDEVGCFGTWDGNKQGSAIISECILEDRVRTATEISNYYNNTKSNYGL